MVNITYDINVRQKVLSTTILHSLFYRNEFISKVVFECSTKQLEIKLVGKGDLLNINESVLLYKNEFSFEGMSNNIFEAPNIRLEIKYIGNDFKTLHNVKATFTYSKYEERILYNNIYSSIDNEGLNNILNDVKKVLQTGRCKNIVFVSDKSVNCVKFIPKFVCSEDILDTYQLIKNIDTSLNLIKFDIPDFFIENINSYNLDVDIENGGKLGVCINGY